MTLLDSANATPTDGGHSSAQKAGNLLVRQALLVEGTNDGLPQILWDG